MLRATAANANAAIDPLWGQDRLNHRENNRDVKIPLFFRKSCSFVKIGEKRRAAAGSTSSVDCKHLQGGQVLSRRGSHEANWLTENRLMARRTGHRPAAQETGCAISPRFVSSFEPLVPPRYSSFPRHTPESPGRVAPNPVDRKDAGPACQCRVLIQVQGQRRNRSPQCHACHLLAIHPERAPHPRIQFAARPAPCDSRHFPLSAHWLFSRT
jgi:hypothetical protein